jgi:hypothetical protein
MQCSCCVAGSHLATASKSLGRVPGLVGAVSKLQQYQQAASTEGPQQLSLEQPLIIDSLTELRQRVGVDPGPWVRGTGKMAVGAVASSFCKFMTARTR